MWSLMICTTIQYCSGDKIANNEVDWVCSTRERGELYAEYWWENLREKTTEENQE
jgi:hypothetical protein